MVMAVSLLLTLHLSHSMQYLLVQYLIISLHLTVDHTYILVSYNIIAPDGSKIIYQAEMNAGGWGSVVNATIVVNSWFSLNHNNLILLRSYLDATTTMNDGCFGLSNTPVLNAVVLFYVNAEDECNDSSRCYTASSAGAIGCLFYNTIQSAGIVFLALFSSLIDSIVQAGSTYLVEVSV